MSVHSFSSELDELEISSERLVTHLSEDFSITLEEARFRLDREFRSLDDTCPELDNDAFIKKLESITREKLKSLRDPETSDSDQVSKSVTSSLGSRVVGLSGRSFRQSETPSPSPQYPGIRSFLEFLEIIQGSFPVASGLEVRHVSLPDPNTGETVRTIPFPWPTHISPDQSWEIWPTVILSNNPDLSGQPLLPKHSSASTDKSTQTMSVGGVTIESDVLPRLQELMKDQPIVAAKLGPAIQKAMSGKKRSSICEDGGVAVTVDTQVENEDNGDKRVIVSLASRG